MRLSERLDETAAAFDRDAEDAIREGKPEDAERLVSLAGHLRRLAFNHRAAADYQANPALDPAQIEDERRRG